MDYGLFELCATRLVILGCLRMPVFGVLTRFVGCFSLFRFVAVAFVTFAFPDYLGCLVMAFILVFT